LQMWYSPTKTCRRSTTEHFTFSLLSSKLPKWRRQRFWLSCKKMITCGVHRISIPPNVTFGNENVPTIENRAPQLFSSKRNLVKVTSTTILT
jgi:hypothetical protein